MSTTQAAVAHHRERWRMSVEARGLVLLTAAMLAFGLATLYSASAIVAMQQDLGSAYFLRRQLTGALIGVAVFAVAAKVDAERWSRWSWPLMLCCLGADAAHGAAVHRSDCAEHPRVAPVPHRRVAAAIGVRQAGRGRLDRHARGQEGRRRPPPAHQGAAPLPRGHRRARPVRGARARSLRGDDVHAGDGGDPLQRGRTHRPLRLPRRARDPGALGADPEPAVRAGAPHHVPRLGRGAREHQLPAQAVADRRRIGRAVRRRLRPGTTAVRLPAIRLQRLHRQQHRRGVGIRRHRRTGARVGAVGLARLPHLPAGAVALPAAHGGGAHLHDAHHGLPAHRRRDRTAAHHRAHAALRVVRPLQSGPLAAHDGDPGQHRQHARAGLQRRRHRSAVGRTPAA